MVIAVSFQSGMFKHRIRKYIVISVSCKEQHQCHEVLPGNVNHHNCVSSDALVDAANWSAMPEESRVIHAHGAGGNSRYNHVLLVVHVVSIVYSVIQQQ